MANSVETFEGVSRRKSLYGFEFREPDLRRVEPEVCKTYNIKQLWQRTHEILRLALLGHKPVVIARILGITPQTVSNTLNSDLGMKKLSVMRLERDKESIEVSKEIDNLLPKALKVYESILDSEQASLSLKKETADTVVMDIAGHRAPTKSESRELHAYATLQEIEEVKRRGREAIQSGGIIDLIPEVTETNKEGK